MSPDTSHPDLEEIVLLNSRQLKMIAGECSDMTLWRWVRSGILPKPKKINGRNFWRKREVIAALSISKGVGKQGESHA